MTSPKGQRSNGYRSSGISQPTASPLGGLERHHAFQSAGIVGDGKYGRSVADIDPNDGFLGRPQTNRFKETGDEIAAPRGFDDEVDRKRFALSVAVLEADCGTAVAVGVDADELSAAILSDGDVSVSLNVLLARSIRSAAGTSRRRSTQIAPGKGIKTRWLEAKVETDSAMAPHRRPRGRVQSSGRDHRARAVHRQGVHAYAAPEASRFGATRRAVGRRAPARQHVQSSRRGRVPPASQPCQRRPLPPAGRSKWLPCLPRPGMETEK